MKIIECIHTKNDCYKAATPMTPKGIVVHSTGANNPNLKRYVDNEVAFGKNTYGNHWNQPAPGGRKVCVHAFIGYDRNNDIATAHILPYEFACWGVGNGKKGSYNYNPQGHIQFEICEDGLTDETYFNKVFKEAAEYCAYLCTKFNLSVNTIVSHNETAKLGYGSDHADCDHWLKKFGKTMDDFRNDVKALLTPAVVEPPSQSKPYSGKFTKGDIVNYKGSVHYGNAFAASGAACKGGKATITAVYPTGKHPYHLVAVSGSGATVYGWVDEAFIEAIAAEKTPWTPKVGDTVNYTGTVHFANNNSNNAVGCRGGQAKITAISQPGKCKHPYHLVRVLGKGATVYGWVNAGTFTKI